MYTPQAMIRGNPSGSNYSEFYSFKLKRSIFGTSDLETDNCVLLDCNPRVLKYCEQPLTIEGIYEGQKRKTTFDVWVEYETGEEFQEIKYKKDLQPISNKYQRVLQQTTLQKNWCLENGKAYTIRTEEDIRKNSHYFMHNMHKIHRAVCGIRDLSMSDLDIITTQLEETPKTIGELSTFSSFTPNKTFQLISWLICNGICTIDLYMRMIDFKTEVRKGCLDLD